MSEILREYLHVVDDPEKHWLYFDILGCLKDLPWSLNQCYWHITPQWLKGSLFTTHAVVQLALYACDPFRNILPDLNCMRVVSRDGTPSRPPGGPYPHSALPDGYYYQAQPEGYIIDQYEDKIQNRKQRRYPCPTIVPLIEALATAFIRYEDSCEYSYGWPTFQAERDASIQFLKKFSWYLDTQKNRRITPEHPSLQRNRKLPDKIHDVINALVSVTDHDYERTQWPTTNNPRHPVTRSRNWWLLQEMDKAFLEHGPIKWPQVATYRALAVIANQMGIQNANRHDQGWKSNAVRMLLKRGPSPGVIWTTTATRPSHDLWHMRLK